VLALYPLSTIFEGLSWPDELVVLVLEHDANTAAARSKIQILLQKTNEFMALNGGPHFKMNEAISFMIPCENQKEIDYYYEFLSADPQAEMCGWLKDKLSWQGPVITDDLMMRGAEFIAPSELIGSHAFAAGCDLLLYGRDLKVARKALDTFEQHAEVGIIGSERLSDAAGRIRVLHDRIM